ncbi:Chaperone protein dnak, partial [Thalictrum thalictroides]
RIVDWIALSFKRDEGIDLWKDTQALQRLFEAAEKAKMELSSLTQANISLPFITSTADGPKHIETTLTRAEFEELCSDLFDRLKIPVENSLKEAEILYKDLDEVILVGGSTRESDFVRDNKFLGSFRLNGTGKKQEITVTVANTLPIAEVERMANEAEKYAEEDKEKRDAIDTKNQAKFCCLPDGEAVPAVGR